MARREGTPSKPERDQLRRRMEAQGCTVEQIATEMMTRWGFRPRQAWRHVHGWTQDEVAARYNQVLGDSRASMTGKRISDYEAWPLAGVKPTLTALSVLARVFGTVSWQLVDQHDRDAMSQHERVALQPRPAQMHEGDRDTGQASTPTRHDIVDAQASGQWREGSSGLVVPKGAIEQAAEESAELATWAGAVNIDDDGLAQLDREVRAIAHAYVFSQPYPLFLRTRKLRNRVARLLRGHQRWRHTRDLYLIGARACTLMAWMSGDLGNYAAAGDHGWAAWMCAQNADHHGARAWVRATQSKLAFWDGDYFESAHLASDGITYNTIESAPLLLALLEARAWARMGRVDDARQALDRWRQLQDGSLRDEIGGLLGVSPAQQHYLAGSTYLWLQEPTQALTETDRSLALFEATPIEQRFYGAEMLARIDACRASLQDGDLEAAESHAEPVLAVEPDQRLETFLQNFAHVRTSLAAREYRDSQIAQSLQERIENYATEAVSRALDFRR